MHHRGPDSAGSWFDADVGIALGHQRLAIQDLSEAGFQPMTSQTGDFVIAFNGEIYNHMQIRADISEVDPLHAWKGWSDTETLLAGIEMWGLQETLRRAEGMFAFAIWDRKNKSLSLARDRFGEKPLYFGFQKNSFIFGSDLRAIRLHPEFENVLNNHSVLLYLRHNAIPAPHSIYEGIRKLLPGSLVTFSQEDLSRKQLKVEEKFWDIQKVISTARANPFEGSLEDASHAVESALKSSIKAQLISDVPIGAFLSGGIDSSLVVALMSEVAPNTVETFTIGSEDTNLDESAVAGKIAEHLGSIHRTQIVTPLEASGLIPLVPEAFSEPFADSSQIPTMLVSRLASNSVTVALSGDAGDELFGGYNRYVVANNHWRKTRLLASPVRKALSESILQLKPALFDNIFTVANTVLPAHLKIVKGINKPQKFARVLAADSEEECYLALTSHVLDPEKYVSENLLLRPESRSFNRDVASGLSFVERMMAADTNGYLADDILVKVDRSAMWNSLETRVPFLNTELFQLAWSLPLEYKVGAGVTKRVLREILYKKVPKSVVNLPKRGFGVPIADWLRGPLNGWASDLLNKDRMNREGIFNANLVWQLWKDHNEGAANNDQILWTILMFQAWLASLSVKPIVSS